MQDSSSNSDNIDIRLAKIESTLGKLSETPKQPDSGILRFAQSVLTFVLGLSALMTASGFIIVNSYLASYTDIHGYSINPSQYITASIGAFIFSMLLLIPLYALSYLFGFFLRIYRNQSLISPLATIIFLTTVLDKLLEQSSIRRYARIVLILDTLVLIILLSMVYGALIYNHIPRYLGGGAPVNVYIVLTDSNTVSAFSANTVLSHPNVIYGVYILAELNDGLLIYNKAHNWSAIIKNSEIKAIFDGNSRHGSSNVIPSYPLTSISTVEPTAEITIMP